MSIASLEKTWRAGEVVGTHPLRKGAISFGLINIPVSLFFGIKRDETVPFIC
jgi:non-homologous end joining protein Ku